MDLKESINYTVPYDYETMLYDFYVLTYIRKDIIDPYHQHFSGRFHQADYIKEDIEYAANILYPKLRKHLLGVLFVGNCPEVRYSLHFTNIAHTSLYHNPMFVEFINAIKTEPVQDVQISIKKAGGTQDESMNMGSVHAAQIALKKTGKIPSDFVEFAKKVFELGWKRAGGEYGGRTWASICSGWLDLNKAKTLDEMAIAIDFTYDLEHNTGVALNKVRGYENKWLRKALDKKGNAISIKQLLPYCSISMKKLALRVIYASSKE